MWLHWLVSAAGLYLFAAVLFGSVAGFREAWLRWLDDLLSFQGITLGILPPLRLLFWLTAAAGLVVLGTR